MCAAREEYDISLLSGRERITSVPAGAVLDATCRVQRDADAEPLAREIQQAIILAPETSLLFVVTGASAPELDDVAAAIVTVPAETRCVVLRAAPGRDAVGAAPARPRGDHRRLARRAARRDGGVLVSEVDPAAAALRRDSTCWRSWSLTAIAISGFWPHLRGLPLAGRRRRRHRDRHGVGPVRHHLPPRARHRARVDGRCPTSSPPAGSRSAPPGCSSASPTRRSSTGC